MFGLKRKEKEEVLMVIPPERPVALAPHKGAIPLGAYENLANELRIYAGSAP